MDKKTLLIFAKRIFNSGSVEKGMLTLGQLKCILMDQGADPECLLLLDKMISSACEMKEISAKTTLLSENNVNIAHRRACERKAREEAARNYGRC